MTDKVSYYLQDKKINDSSSVIHNNSFIYNSKENIPKLSKNYTIQLVSNHDEYQSDEIIKSDESLVLNINYDEYQPIKHDITFEEDGELYQFFKLSLLYNNIHCTAMIKHTDSSYDLILNGYKGIYIKYLDDFILYSQHIKKKKTIILHNEHSFNIDMSDDQLVYYPIYIISNKKYTVSDFINIYPLLIKNVIKFNL